MIRPTSHGLLFVYFLLCIYLSDGEGDAAVAGRGEDAEARLVEDLEGAGRDDPVALVPRYHS